MRGPRGARPFGILSLRARARELARLIWREHRSPARVAGALLVGFIVGCTPLFGLQLFLCMGLAWLLRLNLPIMYGAANISIPPLVPLLGWVSVELGTYVASGQLLALGRADFTAARLPDTLKVCFWAWLRGGVILGAALGVVVGGTVYALLRRRSRRLPQEEIVNERSRGVAGVDGVADVGGVNGVASVGGVAGVGGESGVAGMNGVARVDGVDGVAGVPALGGPPTLAARPDVAAALAAAARRYAVTPRRFRYYARAKYRLDPCYSALCARIPAGAAVVDLGCGLGMLAVALAELGDGRRTLGIDWDCAKIAAGQQAAAGLAGVTLQRGDLREQPLAACDFITLVDVLHYYEPAVQTQVLQRAAAALRPGGQLLIRETDPARRGGARLTRSIERLMVRLGWNRGPAVHYRPLTELHAELQALGLVTEQLELAGATHPGNVLVCARRPALPEAPASP